MSKLVKKVTSRKKANVTIQGGTSFQPTDQVKDRYEMLESRINRLQDDLAEMILLEETPIAVSVYGMGYEEYMGLPGNVRL